MVDGYSLREVIGRAPTGTVYRAEETGRPGRLVAIRRFDTTPSPGQVAAVHRDAELLDHLAHPGIVRLRAIARDGDRVALVTELLPGGTLAGRMARRALTPLEVANLGVLIGEALTAAHDVGIVHGDVTPPNVVYDAEGQPCLTGFGAAFLSNRRSEQPPGPLGDQYRLGAMLHEALVAPDAPASVIAPIERALADDPARRFPTVREFARRLEEAARELRSDPAVERRVPEASPSTAPASRDAPASRRRPDPKRALPSRLLQALAAIAVLLVPIGVATGWWLGSDQPVSSNRQADGGGLAVGDTSQREAATPCPDAPMLPPDSGELVMADLEGRGCTVEVGWDADRQVLTVPRIGLGAQRLQLGEPGDVLLLGDWDCDRRDTPALYRPTTGEVFEFTGIASDGEPMESRPARSTGVRDGRPVVVTDDRGCARIEVREGT